MVSENNAEGTLVDTESNCCSETACSTESAGQVEPQRFVRSKPVVDIIESPDEVTLIADVPGANESTVELEIENGVLRLNARTAVANAEVPAAFRQRSREYVRTFRISDDLDVSAAEATVSHGVLNVRLPKKPTAVPAKIKVRGAEH